MTSELILYGVGRSGTTALSSTIQKMLSFIYGDSFYLIYEPFLWDPNTLNRDVRELTEKFSFMSSTNVTGIYANKVLPLLHIKNPQTCFEALDENVKQYLKNICIKPPDKKFLFSKMIRGNGRALLFNYLNPKVKNIFVIRNPLDVINSVIGFFSFYGTDFHASDYERFYQEAINLYGDYAKTFPVSTHIQKEAFYWYFSNKTFLESMSNKSNVLMIAYDDYIQHKSEVLASVSNFIGIETNDSILEGANKNVGHITKGLNLSVEDYKHMLFYHDKFKELIEHYFPSADINFDNIIEKYEQGALPSREDNVLSGRTPLYLQNLYRKMQREIRKNKQKSKFSRIVRILIGKH